MIDASERFIAETATDVLGHRSAVVDIPVPDEATGLYCWHERGFRGRHRRPRAPRRPLGGRKLPEQLSLNLAAA